MKKSLLILSAAALLAAGNSAQAQLIVAWDTINGTTVAATDLDPNVTGDVLARGSGLTQNSGGDFNSRDWSQGADLATAISDGSFLTFGVAADPGFTIDLTDLDFFLDNSGTGPDSFQTQYNIGSGWVDLGAVFDPNNGTLFNQDLSSIGPVADIDFRFVGWGASSAAGTADLETGEVFTNYGLALSGTVIPEPSAGLLLLTGLGAMAMRRHRA